MVQPTDITAHMDVLPADGPHVGTIDHMEGDQFIKLTRTDLAAHGRHHALPRVWLDHVNEHVHVTARAAAVRAQREDDVGTPPE